MLEVDALTVDDVCELLSLSRNTVYKLAKEGSLPSFKVGRKLRFSRSDVESVLAQRSSASLSVASSPASGDASAAVTLQQVVGGIRGSAGEPLVLAGEDGILGQLAYRVKAYGYEPSVLFMNSYAALASLYTGDVDAAITNLYDFKTNAYNVPFAQRLCPGTSLCVVHLFRRRPGFIVRAGNPQKINTWGALTREEVRIAVRELGSGFRVLFDQKMIGLEASLEEVMARSVVCDSNELALARVAQGSCDVCLGYKEDVPLVKGVQFIPQQMESVDLVIRRTSRNHRALRVLKQIASSAAFSNELARALHCDVENCGSVIYQC